MVLEMDTKKIVFDVVNQKQLLSVMNNTKWRELVDAVLSLEFAPAFQGNMYWMTPFSLIISMMFGFLATGSKV
jgi:hypothetical protein